MNSVSVVRGELIASEDFHYNRTLTSGAEGGRGWADAWSGVNFITVGSLPFAGLKNDGHKLTVNGAQSGSDSVKCSFRAISADGHEALTEDGKLGRDHTTVWIGFLVNSPAGRSSGYGGISLFDDQRQELFLGDTGASNVWAFERSRQLQRFSDVEATDEACFLVYRIRFLPGNERIDMWVNPTPGDEPSESEVAASESAVRDFRFNRVRLCAAPVPMSFDALRIGTTYRDVAPPAANISIVWLVIVQAILLLSLGALTLMLWKQKRRPPIVSTEKLATE